MSGKSRPSLVKKTLENLKYCNLSPTDKDCIKTALEKQIPKKPLPYKGYEGQCPECGVVYLDRLTGYCGNCGQKLFWNTEVENE